MDATLFAVVIVAAVLHASWKALVKTGGRPELTVALIGIADSMMVLPFCPFIAPPPAAAWPWLLGSVASHLAYYELLSRAFRLGDLSQVYPVTRGLALRQPFAALVMHRCGRDLTRAVPALWQPVTMAGAMSRAPIAYVSALRGRRWFWPRGSAPGCCASRSAGDGSHTPPWWPLARRRRS